ncbi:hypothetical protein KJ839_04830 [Patescibacteria group bacterium]|nr:hypothetical protein [Patescibacteria group bacterium]MBU1964053.1 hypothetical protein [Patescibacteria group bacterium]
MLENNDVKLTKSLDANFSKENLIRKYHDKIIITGQSDIMEWNLEYTPILNKPQQINDVRTSKNNWEKINWQVIYPLAKVTGHISINHRLLSQVFTISDYGYIDNNWGKFIPIKCHWNWVQIFSENSEIIITFGEIATSKKKYMSFIHKNQNYIFRDEEIKIKHSAWEWDKLKKIKVPVTSIVTVTNKKIDILIKIKTNNFETLDLKTFFPLPHMYINEQSVIAEGIIKKNGGEKVNFKGYGLKEYTDRGYPIMDKIRYTVINGH